jgi:ABC-type transport system involved in multi-copper enzyme maturation permease subunit
MSRKGQLLAVMRLEMTRGLSPLRTLWLLFLAFAPVVIIAGHVLTDSTHRLDEETLVLAGIVQVFYVRFGIFFGCLGIFLRLLRGEMSERTLHYPLLAPLRREVLVAGKFLAGALTAILVFGAAVLACSILIFGHFDAGRDFALNGPGLAQVRAYLLISTLACIGYGALLLALSLLFRNPIVPAVIAVLWEGINGILPVWLKRFSVTFYLKPLFPVEIPIEGISGLFTVAAEPTPAWLAVTGLILFAAAVLAFACWRVRRLEISYSSD